MLDRKLLAAATHDYRYSWKDLALTDVAYKLLAYAVLVPVVSILLHLLLALSGRTVVADEDLVAFFLEPIGWICLVIITALSIAIVALEQTALMAVVGAAQAERHLGVTRAILFALSKAWPVLRVTTRIVGWTILAAAPFLAIAAVTYMALLSKFDINFYLTQKPPEFKTAVVIASVLAVGLTLLLLRLATSWFYALPLVIFEQIKPREALKVSRDRVAGHRVTVVVWIVAWLLATTLLSVLATASVALLGRLLVPLASHSLALLLLGAGSTLIAWTAVNLVANLLSTTTFAVMFFRLYADRAASQPVDGSQLASSVAKQPAGRLALTRWRLVALVFVSALLATAVGLVALRSIRPVDHVEIIAHRGASGAAPENTMAAFQQAVAEGADWTEFDVQENADDEVVVVHDSDFKKLANLGLKVRNATRDDLQAIDIGSWFGPEFKDQRVPTLAQVLGYCRGKIKATIELKYYGHNQQLERRVAEIVEAQRMQDDVQIISLKQDLLDKMKQLRPTWRTGLLTAVAIGDLTKVRADFLAVNTQIATRSFIRSAHQRHKQVLVWTVNDPVTMSTMIGRGADGLITDRPALARQVLNERANMSSVERLLIQLAGLLGVPRDVAPQ